MKNSKFKIHSSRLRYFLLLFAVCCSLFSVYGCGYTIQTRADLPFDTVYVGRIENKTLEPKMQDHFNRVLSETLAEYGFRVGQSRYVLEGEITEFKLRPMVEQSLVATQYEVVINADFRLIDKTTNRSISMRPSSPFITYFGSSGKLENVLAQKEVSTTAALRNLSQELARQLIYNISKNFEQLLFKSADISDPGSLAAKLQEPKDPLSAYIRKQLSHNTLRLVDEYDKFEHPSDSLKNALAGDLNMLIQKASFYDEERFSHITLQDRTKDLLEQHPKGEDRTRLNRMLLEDAYPDEIIRMRENPEEKPPVKKVRE